MAYTKELISVGAGLSNRRTAAMQTPRYVRPSQHGHLHNINVEVALVGLGGRGGISVAAVTAAYGSALTAGHFCKDVYGPDTWLTHVRGHGGRIIDHNQAY
jgi:hypothetical protein